MAIRKEKPKTYATQRYKQYHNTKATKNISEKSKQKAKPKPKLKPKPKQIKDIRKVKSVKKVKSSKIPKIQYKYEMDKSSKISFSTFITIFVIFAGCMGCLFFNASISAKGVLINEINSSIKKQEEENANLLAKISSSYDLSYIEKVASTKLGMSKPQSYQIINIDVPKESYIVQYDPKEKEVEKTLFFSDIKNLFKAKNKE